MFKPDIYDRLWQDRLKQEALARAAEAEEQARLAALAAIPPALSLAPGRNALCIAGLNLAVPAGAAVLDLEATLEVGTCLVPVQVQRRPAAEGLALPDAVAQFTGTLRAQHAGFSVVRESQTLLAGHPAVCLDYHLSEGEARRHGRAVCALAPCASGSARHWLAISTVFDPSHPALVQWLAAFDGLLAGITAQP